MFEMANASENHGGAGFVGSLDSLVITLGTARLDDRRYSGVGTHLHAIRHREECIRGHHSPPGPFAGPFHGQEAGIDTRGLPHP